MRKQSTPMGKPQYTATWVSTARISFGVRPLPSAPRVWVSFWCANRHETRPSFATDAAIPDTWECPRCGNPAGQNEHAPPNPPRVEPYKTHLAYVKERRSDSDGEAILAEALARLRGASA